MGKTCAADEAYAHSAFPRGDGHDGIGRPHRWGIADYENVAVVVGQLVRAGKARTERLANGTDQALLRRLELADETRQLRLGIGGHGPRDTSGCLHEISRRGESAAVAGPASWPGRMRRFVRVPIRIRAARRRLCATDVVGLDFRKDEILGRDRRAVQSSQDGELADVCHGVRERSLQELLVADARGERVIGEITMEGAKRVVKSHEFSIHGSKPRRLEVPAMQHCSGIAEKAGHVPHDLERRSNGRRRTKVGKGRGRVAQGLLGPIRKRREKMLKQAA